MYIIVYIIFRLVFLLLMSSSLIVSVILLAPELDEGECEHYCKEDQSSCRCASQLPVAEGLLIVGRPMALAVFGVSTPPAQVPVQAKPRQIIGKLVQVSGFSAVRVQVLHPQEHFAAQTADVQPGKQGGEEVPQVHPPAGAGGEAAPGRSFF